MTRTTLRDIAQETACAHSTVSLALRGSPKVNPQTTARIRAAAQRLGYQPHPLISALMQSRRVRTATHLRAQIGFLCFHAERPDAMSVTTKKVLEGASARAQECGYHVEPIWADTPSIPAERLARILEARGIHGVIVGPAPTNAGGVRLPWDRFACISLNLGMLPGSDYVGHNYFAGMNLALGRCRQNGFRRIGVALPGWKNPEMIEQYLLPFRASMATDLLADQIPPILYPLRPAEAFREWLNRFRPDVVISSVDSEEDCEFVRQHIPAEISYVSLNATPGLTAGVDQNRPLVGAIAVDQLVGKLNRNERGLGEHACVTFVSGRWLPGPTFSDVPAPALGAANRR